MRNNAQDANLPGRFGDRGDRALPAAASAAAATSASAADDDELSGRIGGPGGRDLSGSATTATASAGAPVWRTRLNAAMRAVTRVNRVTASCPLHLSCAVLRSA
jgi:hypothetical protein